MTGPDTSRLTYAPKERDAIGKAITLTYEYFGRPPPPLERVRYHVNDLEAAGLPAELVLDAYFRWRMNDSRNTAPPTPAQIRAMIRPEMDPDGIAKELAARIVAAIKKYGYTFPAEARTWVGEDAWLIVRQYGGWDAICADMGATLDPQTFIAQSRDLLRARLQAAPLALERARAHIAAQSVRLLAIPRGYEARALAAPSAPLELSEPPAPASPERQEEIQKIAEKLGLGKDLMAQISRKTAPAAAARAAEGEP